MDNKKRANRKYYEKWHKSHSNPDGIVFEIINTVTGDNYVGTTTAPLKKRLWQAIASANADRTGALYNNIREYGKEVFDIRVLSDNIHDFDEYIAKCNPTLNKKQ